MGLDNSDIRFRKIVETFQEKVRDTCYRYVHSREDATDLAQDVFIQIHKSLSDFKDESELSTWIFRIAVNKSLDFIRKKNRKKRFAVLTSLFGLDGIAMEIEDPIAKNPEKILEEKSRTLILKKALAKLPENQRSAIILSKYQGFSNKEIAEILKLSLSAVESLMHRGKTNLTKRLSNYIEENI